MFFTMVSKSHPIIWVTFPGKFVTKNFPKSYDLVTLSVIHIRKLLICKFLLNRPQITKLSKGTILQIGVYKTWCIVTSHYQAPNHQFIKFVSLQPQITPHALVIVNSGQRSSSVTDWLEF